MQIKSSILVNLVIPRPPCISIYVKIEAIRGQNKFQNTWVDWKQGEMKGTLVQKELASHLLCGDGEWCIVLPQLSYSITSNKVQQTCFYISFSTHSVPFATICLLKCCTDLDCPKLFFYPLVKWGKVMNFFQLLTPQNGW